jgi:hypothetical protein
MKSTFQLEARFTDVITINEAAATENIATALSNIGSLLQVPDAIPPFTLERDDDYFRNKPGSMAHYDTLRRSIAINPNYMESALGRGAVYHEVAHYLWDAVGSDKSELLNIVIAVKKTNGYLKAVQQDEQNNKQYWSLDEELWARMFAQYICRTAPDVYALEWLTKANIQWSEEEFAPFTRSIEQALYQIGIITQRQSGTTM